MSGERYAELAVEALRGAIADGIVGQLAVIAEEQGLTEPIPPPVAVVQSRNLFDPRTPLISVFWEDFDRFDQRNGLMNVDCRVMVTAAARTAGVEALPQLEELLSRYTTALIDLIRGDPSLGDKVVEAQIVGGGMDSDPGDKQTARMGSMLGVEVQVDSP